LSGEGCKLCSCRVASNPNYNVLDADAGSGGTRWGEVGRGGARWGEVGRGGARWDEVGRGGTRWGDTFSILPPIFSDNANHDIN